MPNIIDQRRFASIQTEPAADRCTRLSFVGRLSPEKNLLNLIKAVGLVHRKGYRLRLSLCGAANSSPYFVQLQQLVSDEQLDNVVRFTGPVDQVEEVYRQTDLLCLVSVFEGFSNVLSEAICCGLPVLASDIDENRYLVTQDINGFLVPSGDVNAIAAGIEKFLLLDDSSRTEISANNRQKALELFDENRIFRQYLEIFRKANLPV